jgi:glycosyltransferase involved in cell wall biosynthesis
MASQTLISVIVPVYNVEPYLRRCLDSILGQTYENLEIIVVDDGSTDGCPAICDGYAEKDRRVLVIHQQNGGLSAARNAGLDICTGEVIAFVDSDDWILPDMYGEMLAAMQAADAQIAICGYLSVDEHENVLGERKFTKRICTSGEIIKGLLLGSNVGDVGHIVWNKTYDRSIFSRLRFPNRIAEDSFILHRSIGSSRHVAFLDKSLYCYLKRSTSLVHNRSHEDRIQAIIDIGAGVEEYVRNNFPQYCDYASWHTVQYYYCAAADFYFKGVNKSHPGMYQELIGQLRCKYSAADRSKCFLRKRDLLRIKALLYCPVLLRADSALIPLKRRILSLLGRGRA